MAKETYTRDEVAAVLAELEQDGKALIDIFTMQPCKECSQKPCPDGAHCWLDDLTTQQLALMWLDRREV